MTLKQLANGYADVEQRLNLLKQRQNDIGIKPKLGDYFTAFVMDKIRQDEFNACKKYEWQKENKKSGGNGNER